jgi:hypothetical protein
VNYYQNGLVTLEMTAMLGEVASYVLGEVIGGLLIRRLAKQFAIHIVEFYFSPFVNQRQNKN